MITGAKRIFQDIGLMRVYMRDWCDPIYSSKCREGNGSPSAQRGVVRDRKRRVADDKVVTVGSSYKRER